MLKKKNNIIEKNRIKNFNNKINTKYGKNNKHFKYFLIMIRIKIYN